MTTKQQPQMRPGDTVSMRHGKQLFRGVVGPDGTATLKEAFPHEEQPK